MNAERRPREGAAHGSAGRPDQGPQYRGDPADCLTRFVPAAIHLPNGVVVAPERATPDEFRAAIDHAARECLEGEPTSILFAVLCAAAVHSTGTETGGVA